MYIYFSVSLSPKNAPKMDRLQRPALHSDDQLNMSQDSTNSEGEIDVDDNITFNFHKTQREPDNGNYLNFILKFEYGRD